MALAQEKRGGPYTKREQEERRLDVYHLHFEEKLPAVTIADTLKVNRNTINEDIKFCREQLSNEFGKKELASRMKKQLHRLEIQRTRFLDYLDEFTTLQERLAIEKSIVNVDKTLNGILSEIIDNKLDLNPEIEQVAEVISDEELKKAIKDALNRGKIEYSTTELRYNFIKNQKCSLGHANLMISKMYDDGLLLCKMSGNSLNYEMGREEDNTYDITKFASMRGIC